MAGSEASHVERASMGPYPPSIELRAACIPVIGCFAHHHWFVVDRDGARDRWEVWQRANAGGTSWGHLHLNLLPPERGVGNGPSWVVHAWHDDAAEMLAARIEASPRIYPFAGYYLPWPGPNSNTYVQWMLGDRFRLARKAPGKTFALFRRANLKRCSQAPYAHRSLAHAADIQPGFFGSTFR